MFVRSPADEVADRPTAGDKSSLSPFLSMRRMPVAVPKPAGYFWHMACITLGCKLDEIAKERSPPMKVKTNTKAGSAMWGS
jgi:hypothetical protein